MDWIKRIGDGWMKRNLVWLIIVTILGIGMVGCGSGADSDEKGVTMSTGETAGIILETTEAKSGEADPSEEETAMMETTVEEADSKAPVEEEPEAGEFGLGMWDGLEFTNLWLDVAILFPEGSHVYTGEEMEGILGTGKEIFVNSGDSRDVEQRIDDILILYDFMVTLPDGRSSVQLSYDRLDLSGTGRQISAEEYLDEMSRQLSSIADMQYELDEIENVKLGNRDFAKLSGSLIGGAMYQEYYSACMGDYMAVLTASYLPESKDVVEELIKGMTAAK